MAKLDLDGDGKVDEDWTEHKDAASGRSYFHNSKTGETQWEIPGESLMAKLDLDGDGKVDDEWTEHTDPVSSRRYFHSTKTGETVWELSKAAAKKTEEEQIRENIERMEAAVQLPSAPWPEHPLQAARAIENRLLRVQEAARDLDEEDATKQAVLKAHAWREALQKAEAASEQGASASASVLNAEESDAMPELLDERLSQAADEGAHYDHPWLMYSAFGLGVVAYIASAYRVRGTVPGSVGQVMKARAEAATARERSRANARIVAQRSSTTGGTLTRCPTRKWPPVRETVQTDGPGDAPSLVAKLDALPSRVERARNVQTPHTASYPTSARAQRLSTRNPKLCARDAPPAASAPPAVESYDSPPMRPVQVRTGGPGDGPSLIAKLDGLPSRAERARNVQTPTASHGGSARGQRQSKPRGGNHERIR